MKRFLVLFIVFAVSLVSLPCFAISEKQEKAIVTNCDSIIAQLKNVQKDDARTRVHLGGRFEAILTRFMTPLNVRLIENNITNTELVENQSGFSDAKTLFTTDYVNYQQELEKLVAMDCKKEPSNFYESLEKARQKRKTVEQDVIKLRSLISKHVKLVTTLRSKL